MKLFRKYERCYGISLPAIGCWKFELWFCMPNYTIKPHSHDNEDIRLYFLWGSNVMFHRRKQDELLGESYMADFPKDFLRKFSIPAGAIHYFEVSNLPLIFFNIERWKDGIKPTSASEDLTPRDY